MVKTVVAGRRSSFPSDVHKSYAYSYWRIIYHGQDFSQTLSDLTVSSKQKKGIKSSIGRLFGKKEKGGRMEQTVGRDGQPLPALSGPLPATSIHTAGCVSFVERAAK